MSDLLLFTPLPTGFGPDRSVDCSSGGHVAAIRGQEIKFKYGDQVPLSIKGAAMPGFMSMAAGLITHGDKAERILRAGQADLIAVGREILNNPSWSLFAALKSGAAGPFRQVPPQFGYWLDMAPNVASGPSPRFGRSISQVGLGRSDLAGRPVWLTWRIGKMIPALKKPEWSRMVM